MKWLVAGIFFLFSYGVSAKDIELWHALDGFLEEKLSELVEEFNAQGGHPRIQLVQKENYKVVYEEGIAAHRQGRGPQILQVYEVATLSMMLDEKTYIPVGDLMQKYHYRFDPDVYIDVVRKFYSAPNGQMLSLPWNVSTGVLYYNKRAFVEAGLDPESPPRTWPEVERAAKALKKQRYIGFTTAWPVAYHLEHVCCWHDLPYATQQNGFLGLGARLLFHQGEVKFHLKKVAEWSRKGLFSYSGRYAVEPERRFAEGECAILLQGSNRLPILKKQCDFEIGVGSTPYWPHLIDQPANLNIGGASFWVMKGFSEEEYRGIAAFFAFLSSPEVQAAWHQSTGYLPITDAAYYLTKKKGFYETHPAAEIAVLEVLRNSPTEHSFGMRLGNYVEVREVITDHLEKAFSGEETAEEALNRAAIEGNRLLEAFEKDHKPR
ncbi:MAG: extracellular solute-binding protein [Chlamydiia bacterium]|nr:extracellular solute-binding protein [Chlamydiia bacterium]